MDSSTLYFACDAMLGGVARWLRLFGYESFWEYGIEDSRLIEISLENDWILLTSDSGIMKRRIIRDGKIRSLYIPHSLSRDEQLKTIVDSFRLTRQEPRCMKCSGFLRLISKENAHERIPPKTYAWLDEFMECSKCSQLFWKGTHWRQINRSLERIQPPI